MRISRIKIVNFRNFEHFEVNLETHYIVIVGENNAGKSNLIHALRLVIDNSLPNSERYLSDTDFWDGLERPFGGNKISITIEFSDFENEPAEMASLRDCFRNTPDGLKSVFTYIYKPQLGTAVADETTLSKDDYEYYYYCDTSERHQITDLSFQKFISLEVLPALRNAASDLESWRRSPLSSMIERLEIDRDELKELGKEIDLVISQILDMTPIAELQESISDRLRHMIGEIESVDPRLDFLPTDPDRLMRFLRLFVEGVQKRNIDEIGTGYANILYIVLLLLDARQRRQNAEHAAMILAVEEPEAHLHPHLQRLVYGDLLNEPEDDVPVLMTTHSPHIASIAPLRSLLLLRKTTRGTAGYNTKGTALLEMEIQDIERYLDITRAELIFSQGVVLVEGIAEAILINEFARRMGHSLDKFGISIIRVEGTDFIPYIKLLGPSGFDIPTVVITDGDPYRDGSTINLRGIQRGIDILEATYGDDISILPNLPDAWIIFALSHHGIFIGEHTLEIDLVDAGYESEYLNVFAELGEGSQSISNTENVFRQWNTLDFEEKEIKIIGKIKRVGGKGRFAQRLASKLDNSRIPEYIRFALSYMGIK